MNKKYAAIIAYLATIPLANWFIGHVGTQSFPGGPHTIPVGFGYQAPSGVLLIGIALFTRDYVQEKFGKRNVLIAIAAGIAISFFVNPNVATASAVAFAAGEIVDFFVYTRIKTKSIALAVVFSGVVGGIIDSFLFLRIAFGSTNFWQGQVVGKTWMALLGGLIMWSHGALSHRLHPQEA